MSSVTRFLRQVPTGQALYGNGNNNSLGAIADAACLFVPGSGNYVGNYPPGLVCPADAATQAAIRTAAAGLTQNLPIVRDMGKTIFAQTASSLANAQAGTGSGSYGYFRQVQVLIPQPISAVQGFLGGVGGSVFGVVGGSPNAYAPYLTVYVPTTVAGVSNLIAGAVDSLPAAPLGQM
jgi:hypothetical protein